MFFKKKILLVDDNKEILDTALFILESWGLDVTIFTDGQTALKSAFSKHYDVFILDMNMPQMNGLAVCQLLKDNRKTADIPVMFLTGEGKTGEVDKAYGCGAAEYVIKPVDWDRMKIKLEKLLKKKLKN